MSKLDKYYTKPEVAQECVQFLRRYCELEYCLEPSAGDGSFLSFLPEDTVAIDIEPDNAYIRTQDFFTFNTLVPNWTVVGNPPFGKRSSLAISFFNHAAEIKAKFIAMIFPVSFMKWGVQKELDSHYSLIDYFFLKENSFTENGKDFNVRCVFQIWERDSLHKNLRILSAPPTKYPDFELWQYNATIAAKNYVYKPWEYAVYRQGYKDYKKIFSRETDFEEVENIIQNTNIQMFLMKPLTEEARNFILNADYENLALRNTSTPGFGKADFISYYLETKNNLPN